MSRGKYGASAAVRREASEQAAEVAAYQQKVVKLTARAKKAEEDLAAFRRASSKQIKDLRAQIREGVSPATVVAQREAATRREERDSARQELKDLKRTHERFMVKFIQYVQESTGATGLEAMETVMRLGASSGQDLSQTVMNDLGLDLTADAIFAIQRAQGRRRS